MTNFIKKEDIKDFEKTEKLGLVATIDENLDPHISLLTTIMASDEKTMVIGQFAKGISKENILNRSKSGFAIVSLKMEFWRGLIDWRNEVKTEGPEYIKYNNMKMWRFNTYFGIDRVYYGDLVDISEKSRLNLIGIAINAIIVMLKKRKFKTDRKDIVMRPYATKLFSGLSNPKFLSFINESGYPEIVPIIQAQSADSSTIVFTAKPYQEMFKDLKKGARVAVFAVSMQMESVLVKGEFLGFEKGIGSVNIDKIYNSMPPVSGYIYPETPYKEVTEF